MSAGCAGYFPRHRHLGDKFAAVFTANGLTDHAARVRSLIEAETLPGDVPVRVVVLTTKYPVLGTIAVFRGPLI